nr:olfactory receptor 52N2-like [Pelodiscus sinensis]|eukprot:XP_014427535.1 olfactory receptor 52N2-like [Pelodiscus sinensis]
MNVKGSDGVKFNAAMRWSMHPSVLEMFMGSVKGKKQSEEGTLSISENKSGIKPIMAALNLTLSKPFTFFLTGKEQSLHTPMYWLLCMLALTDISTGTLVVPKTLCIFWFNLKDITMAGCLTQMFYIDTVQFMHSAILVIMAFDRYVAICIPLRYATILTNARIAKLVVVGLIRAVLFVLPMPLLVSRLPFCDNRLIPQTYCNFMTVAKISCGDIKINAVYGLVITIVNIVLDVSLIALSYGFIVRAVLRISSKEAHEKALSTCTAHVCVMLLHWIPCLFSIMTHRFGQGIALHTHVILANLYLLVPSMLNPFIYGLHSREFREKLGKYIIKR